MKLHQRHIKKFQKTIWDFYRMRGRRFPWRAAHDPYQILVSELMLQQTQVSRVISFYKKFIRTFPTVRALAAAPVREVLRLWQGLGYNRRALALKGSAEMILEKHGGKVPRDLEKLDALPGIGRATAAAILAYAWNEPVAFVETNIRAVFIHHFFPRRRKIRDKELLPLVAATFPGGTSPAPFGVYSNVLKNIRITIGGDNGGNRRRHSDILQNARMSLPRISVREWYSALMDYGAHLKETVGNAARRSAHYTKQSAFLGSRREARGAILRRALAGPIKQRDFPADILSDLVREGFLRKRGEVFCMR